MLLARPLVLADNVRRPRRSVLGSVASPAAGYKPEHSERQVSGSLEVAAGVWWMASLAVPMTGDQSLLITVQREGPLPPGAPMVEDVALVIPAGEAEKVVELLNGLIEHAKRDGVLSTE